MAEIVKKRENEKTSKFEPFGTVGNIIQLDWQRRHKLVEIYDDIEGLLKNPFIDASLINELDTEFGNITLNIPKEKEELTITKCPIVISGETSAGKSSFINLLIGVDILPQRLLSCTTTICRIQNSSIKAICAIREDGTEDIASVNPDDDQVTFQTKLKGYVSRKSDVQNYKYVDIWYPLPILQENIIIVDTPGIGTSKELTDRLFDYLPEALAFIYVINSGNAGGLQPDRLIKIFDAQKHRMKRNAKLIFDSSAAIFVCNKWDQVPVGEHDEILEFIQTTLEENWVNLNPKQIFTLSVKNEKMELEKMQDYTDKFKSLMTCINDIIPSGLEARVQGHARLQLQIAETCLQRIVHRIRLSKLSNEEKVTMKTEAEDRLSRIQEITKKTKAESYLNTEKLCMELAGSLFEHLHSTETYKNLFNFQLHEIPDDDDEYIVRNKGQKLIEEKIGKEIRIWCKERNISALLQNERSIFRKKCFLIDSDIDEHKESSIILDGILSWKIATSATQSGYFNFSIIFLVRNALSSIKATLSLAFPKHFSLALSTKEKLEILQTLSEESLKTYTKEHLQSTLMKTVFKDFRKEIDYLLAEIVPRKIEADRKFIENVVKEIRSTYEIVERYAPLESKCKTLIGKILVMHFDNFSETLFSESNIKEDEVLEEIGVGAFSVVNKVYILLQHKKVLAAAKTMKTQLKDDPAYEQLAEMHNLRKLKHKNIVCLYGFGIKQGDFMKFLRLYMELCEETLENTVFKDKNLRPCYKNRTIPNDSWSFVMEVMSGVSAGLAYIHNSGFVHRNLKLANILMKDGVPKISDVGLSKPECSIKGTVTGTSTHMAPEIINGAVYGSEADIYSFGIILWELWYFRPAFSIIEKKKPVEFRFQKWHNICKYVTNGGRPEFKESVTPPDQFQSLAQTCWHQNPNKRPKASDIQKSLEQIKLILTETEKDIPFEHLEIL